MLAETFGAQSDLPKVWADLGMASGQAYTKGVRMVKTCVGTEFCRYGVQDAIHTGVELERRLENDLAAPASDAARHVEVEAVLFAGGRLARGQAVGRMRRVWSDPAQRIAAMAPLQDEQRHFPSQADSVQEGRSRSRTANRITMRTTTI